MDPVANQNTATPAEEKPQLSQPWKAWLAKEQELITSNQIQKEDINLIDQTYLLESEPSQTMG
jgi:hypothetical protein